MADQDQRRTKRFELRLPFRLVRAGSKQLEEIGETENLSSGGVLFTSDQGIEVGDPIEYFITLPAGPNSKDGVKLHCVGKVIRLVEPSDGSTMEKPTAIAATMERYEFVRSGQ